MTTPLDTTLMEELTTSIGGCIGTVELALAAVTDPIAERALLAVASVLSTSYEHLCRVDAMVFPEEAAAGPAGPQVMGQPEGGDGECIHLDLTPVRTMGAVEWMCADCDTLVTIEEGP